MTDISFTVGRTSVGLNNPDSYGRPSLGEVEMKSDLIRFTAHVHADGEVTLPQILIDTELCAALCEMARDETLEAISRRFENATKRQRQKAASK